MRAERKFVEQEGVINDAHGDAGEIFEEAVEVAAAVTEAPAAPVEGEAGDEGELYVGGRDEREVRGGFDHAETVRDEAR